MHDDKTNYYTDKNDFERVKIKDMTQMSIIIATKNCFEKIDAMMLSLFRQSVRDTEIICVDDASTDTTLNLLNHYAEFDKRVQVIANKKPVGLLKCCHIGLEKATAPYVMFLNGTHHVLLAQAFLERLLNRAKQNNSDVVYTPTVFVDAVMFTAHQMCVLPKEFFEKAVGKDVFKATDVRSDLLFNLYLSPYIKLYRKDFISNADFAAFDEPFFLDAMFRAERVSADMDFLCYRQVQNPELERPQIFDEQKANRQILEKYGTWDAYKTAYIIHKMQSAWRALRYAPAAEKPQMFEKIKAEFKREDFGEYDFNILRKIQLYWTLQTIADMSWEDFTAETTDAE